jgi:hypothetical protein
MILKQFRQYTIDGVNYTSLKDIQKSLNLTMMQIRYRRKKDPNWLIVVKGPSLVKYTPPKKDYYIGDGVKYLTLAEAALAHGITKEAVRQRLKRRKWNWFKVVDGVQQPKEPRKVQRILDTTTWYYRKKMGIPTPRPKTHKKNPYNYYPPPYKTANRVVKVLKTPIPRNLSEYLDEMFAKKDAKKT